MRAFCLVLIGWFGSTLMATASSPDPTRLNVGVARTVITPTEPTWLSGYGARTMPAQGKVHDLYAKALAFDDGQQRFVLITLDLGSISPELTDAVAKGCETRYKLPRGALVLNCSHTHCAPEIAAERRVFHALPQEAEVVLVRYIEKLKLQLIDLVGLAIKDLAPAQVEYSVGQADFASNRRLPTPNGFINSPNKDGITDHSVPTLRITDPQGKLRAIAIGYACHNTTLSFQQYCGDYAGFAQYALEEAYPGAIALFIMGCGGDQNPYPRHGPMALDYARLHGQALATAAKKAMAGEQTSIRGTLKIGFATPTLSLQPLPAREKLIAQRDGTTGLAQRKAAYLLGQLDTLGKIELTQPCPLHAIRFGSDMLFIAVSGETVLDYAIRCKKEFAGPKVWVAGYCDDVFAYLPSQRVRREGGYEGVDGIIHQLTPTPFTEKVEDEVFAGLKQAMK